MQILISGFFLLLKKKNVCVQLSVLIQLNFISYNLASHKRTELLLLLVGVYLSLTFRQAEEFSHMLLHPFALIQVNMLKSKSVKSNFAQVKVFFISPPKLLFVWLILQWISQKWISWTLAKSNMFFPSHTQASWSQASLFQYWMPQDS